MTQFKQESTLSLTHQKLKFLILLDHTLIYENFSCVITLAFPQVHSLSDLFPYVVEFLSLLETDCLIEISKFLYFYVRIKFFSND